jgi:hypothetical protein
MTETFMPSVSTVHKAIRNYLVNELGIHRKSIEDIIVSTVKEAVEHFFQAQLHNEHSFLRKTIQAEVRRAAEAYLQRSLSVALSKVECKAEIIIVDGRMNDPST